MTVEPVLFIKRYSLYIFLLCCPLITHAQAGKVKISTIGNGWANNSVNTVVFRKNSLVTFKGIQYAAYYDNDQFIVLAKRQSGADKWQTERAQYKADATDAHKDICTENEHFFASFKATLLERFGQIEIYVASYLVDIL